MDYSEAIAILEEQYRTVSMCATSEDCRRHNKAIEMAVEVLKKQIQAEESFEWCDGCKEYDQEQHCCHRFTKVIRHAFAEMKIVHCHECQYSEYDDVYKDRYCHYNGKAEVVDDFHYCRDGERRDE